MQTMTQTSCLSLTNTFHAYRYVLLAWTLYTAHGWRHASGVKAGQLLQVCHRSDVRAVALEPISLAQQLLLQCCCSRECQSRCGSVKVLLL